MEKFEQVERFQQLNETTADQFEKYSKLESRAKVWINLIHEEHILSQGGIELVEECGIIAQKVRVLDIALSKNFNLMHNKINTATPLVNSPTYNATSEIRSLADTSRKIETMLSQFEQKLTAGEAKTHYTSSENE